jgi:hypothetical protein
MFESFKFVLVTLKHTFGGVRFEIAGVLSLSKQNENSCVGAQLHKLW